MSSARPDLLFIVTKLSQHMSNRSNSKLNMAKNISISEGDLRAKAHLQKAKGRNKPSWFLWCWLEIFRRSKKHYGYVFKLTTKGPVISWKSRKQPTVNCAVNLRGRVNRVTATQEAKFLRQLLEELISENIAKATDIYCDNQSAIFFSKILPNTSVPNTLT